MEPMELPDARDNVKKEDPTGLCSFARNLPDFY